MSPSCECAERYVECRRYFKRGEKFRTRECFVVYCSHHDILSRYKSNLCCSEDNISTANEIVKAACLDCTIDNLEIRSAMMKSTEGKKSPVGKRVAELRRRRGFSTPQALADAIGVPEITKNVIVNIEQGRKSDLTLTEAMHIAKALRVPLPMLVADIEHPFDRSDVMGFEKYTNADILDLFSFSRTRYGMIRRDINNGFVMLHFFEELHFTREGAYLYNVYEALSIFVSGIRDYALYVSDADAAQRSGNSTAVYQNIMQVADAKEDIQEGMKRLEELNVEIPKEVKRMAKECLQTKIAAGDTDIDYEELWATTKKVLNNQNLLGKIEKAAKEMQKKQQGWEND